MKPFLIALILLVIVSCGKDKDPLSPNRVITGTAFFKNRFALDSSRLLPYANGTVYVRYSSDNVDTYFTQATTDSSGKFYLTLEMLPAVLYIKPTAAGGADSSVPLYGEVQATAETTAPLQLIASFDPGRQNGFLLRLEDTSGGFISGAIVYAYPNASFAALDDPGTALFTLTSDNAGLIYKTHVPAGTYYLRAVKNVNTTVFRSMVKPVTVAPTGFVEDTLLLHSEGPASYGFVLTLRDTLEQPVPEAQVYLFNTPTAATLNNASDALASLVSDGKGVVSRFNLPNGTYYLNAQKTAGAVNFQRIGKPLTIHSDVVVDTVVLRREVTRFSNALVIRVTDSIGGSIPAAQVYLYTSSLLASSSDPDAAIDSLLTDNNGQCSKQNLVPNTYYLNARKGAAGATYERVGKMVVLPTSGTISDTMVVHKL